jgi:hypothetical protein
VAQTFSAAHDFICSKHELVNVMRKGSKADAKLYSDAVKEPSTSRVDDLLSCMSEKCTEYLNKLAPKESLYPAYARAHKGVLLHGRSASQTVESMNSALHIIRHLLPSTMLLETAR